MQRFGLTWVFRLWSEPRRLGPRYLRYKLSLRLVPVGLMDCGPRMDEECGQGIRLDQNVF